MLLYPATTQILFEARKHWYVSGDQEQNKQKDPSWHILKSGENGALFWLLQCFQNLLFLILAWSLFDQKAPPQVAHPVFGGGNGEGIFIPIITNQGLIPGCKPQVPTSYKQ